MKNIIILGGPNGAGKTTAAQLLLPEELAIREFVNADEIARGLSPFNVDQAAIPAGRLMIERMRDLVEAERSFAFETTCAGRQHATWLRARREEGWHITLVYLWLPSVQIALDRVARRVREGGHNIPADVIARRYLAGMRNMLSLYLPLADVATIYDNSEPLPVLIAKQAAGLPLMVYDVPRLAMIEEAAR